MYTCLATAGDRRATTRVVLMLLTTLLASLFAPTAHAQSIRYVDATASGANDGSSWADAYTALQDALAAATNGDEIWVAAGTYYPDDGDGLSENDRTLSFQLKTGVALYGGFAGDETSRDDRDWQANITTLSGDLQQDDGADFANTGENSYYVVFNDEVEETATLDGFTVTGGNADNDDRENIFLPTAGGGIHNFESSPTLTNLIIRGNQAGSGGGLANIFESSPVLTNVTISGNQAGEDGGGLFTLFESTPVLSNVTISGNQAINGGGGVANIGSNLTLTNVTISGNQAFQGGGLFSRSDSNPTLTNVTISGNQADLRGGGLYNEDSTPTIQNSIIWDNSATTEPEVFNVDNNNGPTYRYSLVRDLDPGGTNLDGTNAGNAPLFAAPESADSAPTTAGDYRLQFDSSALDSGDVGLLPTDSADLDEDSDTSEALPVDRNGDPRVVGDTVDLGAYEHPQMMPTISWRTPAAIRYGTTLGAAQLNATADVAGSFAYTPAAGTVLDASPGQRVQVVFMPDEPAQYATISTTVRIAVQTAPLTITVATATGIVGEPPPLFTYTVTGLVNGDTAADVFTTEPTLATTATADSPAGVYPITGSGAVAPNYQITYVAGTLTLTGQDAPETRLYLALIRGPR